MQNITAKYNYLYNANLILKNYEETSNDSYSTNYQQVLPIYLTTDTAVAHTQALDKIIEKARTVIAEKSYNKYMADSYLLLAKAYFFKGNYFLSLEYYDYVVQNYAADLPIYLMGLDGSARSLMQLQNLVHANPILDTLEAKLPEVKKNKVNPLATLAQSKIIKGEFGAAIIYLQAALKEGIGKNQKNRWYYILAQLYEAEKNYSKSLYYYKKVEKSNAPFDLYFNALLNRVKLNGSGKENKKSIASKLEALMKEDKNRGFLDQIYNQLAIITEENAGYSQAEKYYQRAIKENINNQYQKGFSYLQLAELYFKQFKNYPKAKVYFDSALTILPKNYPDYEIILKKGKNLEYLSKHYAIIAQQEVLQKPAKLPEVTEETMQFSFDLKNQSSNNVTFYFSNPTALSQGFSDFKKQWGNRKLADNWRQSIHSTISTNTFNDNSSGLPLNPDAEQQLTTLPLTPELLAASDDIILEAYLEIASYYQYDLKDQAEAAKIYQLLQEKFPENKKVAAMQKSTDPVLSAKRAEQEFDLLRKYNLAFDTYEKRNYKKVIEDVNTILIAGTDNAFAAQFSYLKALAIGRTYPIDSLIAAFKNNPSLFDHDPIIGPLVRSHLAYIQQHLVQFKARTIAIVDTDASELPFLDQHLLNSSLNPSLPKTQRKALPSPIVKKEEQLINVVKKNIVAGSVFNNTPSNSYYFVIAVTNTSTTLSSSRFGIGQFNRGNYADIGLKHRLIEFDNDQIIYVGNFSNFENVKIYADGITPQLQQIMKVPANSYNSFIISKENFEKINNTILLNEYIEFYKNNF
ncbi:tetratricopeptide (TPR) repeat protein [Pedobacter sp. CG_S7]|uniref:type IX secretion system periplasmic lipoprotein PorW/SprE n=1 Tax=Pedobacter sp. CG_S7 TaxID=3143930 RepID=UPI0033959C31